jgi:hypothetical protein
MITKLATPSPPRQTDECPRKLRVRATVPSAPDRSDTAGRSALAPGLVTWTGTTTPRRTAYDMLLVTSDVGRPTQSTRAAPLTRRGLVVACVHKPFYLRPNSRGV